MTRRATMQRFADRLGGKTGSAVALEQIRWVEKALVELLQATPAEPIDVREVYRRRLAWDGSQAASGWDAGTTAETTEILTKSGEVEAARERYGNGAEEIKRPIDWRPEPSAAEVLRRRMLAGDFDTRVRELAEKAGGTERPAAEPPDPSAPTHEAWAEVLEAASGSVPECYLRGDQTSIGAHLAAMAAILRAGGGP